MPAAKLPPVPPHALCATAPQKVLVVDDVAMNAALIASIISSLCEVQTATDGAQALERIKKQPPDLILLDVLMPQMSGFEVCRALKDDPATADIPIIFLTALTDEDAEERGLNLGATDFIAKPFRAPVLRARVRNHLELARQRRLLEQLSHIDGLTSIANRRYFSALLPREFKRMQRQGKPLALLMIDVDDFKAFNDHYGHILGDECLQLVAQAIACCLKRSADMVARYGGEEFVCLLPDTDLTGAIKVAQNIQRAIAQLQRPHAMSQASEYVSVSIGAASTLACASSSSEQLLACADARLYQAKHAGRNRLVAHD